MGEYWKVIGAHSHFRLRLIIPLAAGFQASGLEPGHDVRRGANVDIFPYPLIVADIGGTNARFALTAGPGAPLGPTIRLPVAGLPSFEAAAAEAMTEAGIRARSMIVCAAGPVSGSSIQLTNSAWQLDGPRICMALGFKQGLLLNDFEAMALSLPSLRTASCMPIGTGDGRGPGPCVVAGPGTGLGVAALIQSGGRYAAIASEGGHMSLAPWDDVSEPTLNCMRRRYGRVSAESLISGAGLVRLHLCRGEVFGFDHVGNDIIDAASIVQRGCEDQTSEYATTLKIFWDAVAAFAGDLALCFAASGGIVLAGGILPRMISLLDEGKFRHRFEDKAPMHQLLNTISTKLICDVDAVLNGMRALADAPDQFAIDYDQRCWARIKI